MTVHNVLLPAGCSRRFSSEIEALSSDFGKSESDIAGNEQRTNPVSDSSNEASLGALRHPFQGHENGKDMRRVIEEGSDIAGNEQRTNPVSDSSNEASADALRRAFEGHENGKDMRRVMEEEARKTKAAKEQRDRVKANEETTSW